MHTEGNHTERYAYAYDGVGRLVEERLAFDGSESVALQQLEYDGIGRLSANDLGVFAERYGYNVRSTLEKRYSPVFQQIISYTNPFGTMYNGSIASITDELTGGLSSSNYYTYDNAGRLTSAMIFVGGTSRPTAYAYDLNSNNTSLSRMGDSGIGYSAYIDQLAYQYNGNQLRKITDSAPVVYKESTMHFHDGADEDIEYTYDRNGNMTSDANKGVAYQWDVNNRLSKAIFSGKSINFTRTATSRLLSRGQGLAPKSKASVFDPTNPIIGGGTPINEVPVHHYYGTYEYTNEKFTRLNTSTGYIDSLGQHVYIRDWQGNIRAVVRSGENGSPLLEQATYYPYGMPMSESTNPATNRYKYTAKELLTENNLDLYDFGARMYDPETNTWSSADEMSSGYTSLSHYLFCAGNPINCIDPTGKDIFVLNYGNDMSHQHLAMLIQNADGKWQYYSINGDNVYVSGGHVGGRPFNDIAVGSWDSPQEFLNSDYNVRNDDSKEDKNMNHFGFSEGYHIKSTPEQDEKMRNSFSKTANTEYNLLTNNCATAVQKAMIEAGLPVSKPEIQPSYIPVSTPFGMIDVYNGFQIKCNINIIPSQAFQSIMNWNPEGNYIHKTLF